MRTQAHSINKGVLGYRITYEDRGEIDWLEITYYQGYIRIRDRCGYALTAWPTRINKTVQKYINRLIEEQQ